jgi:cell division protein FtsQ
MAVYQRMLAELDANNQHLSEQISEIDLTDAQDARVLMPEQGADILAHFGEDQFLGRYQRYKTHIAEWRQQYPKLAAVDLRYDNQVVLEMTPGTNAVAAAVDGPGGDSGTGDSASAKTPAAESAHASIPGAAKPAASKPEVSKPEASTKPVQEGVKHPAVKKASGRLKVATQKAKLAEKLAAKQRAARAAREKAAREKAERDKKRVAEQHAALSRQKPTATTHTAAYAAQGQ